MNKINGATEDAFDQLPQNTSPDDTEKRLMDLRLQIGTQLMLSGAEPMVERGTLSPTNFKKDNPQFLHLESRWTRLVATNQASKINHVTTDVTFERGPRPSLPFLQQEVVYELKAPDSRLFGRYQDDNPSRRFYLSIAENNTGRKTMDEVLDNASGLDDIEKVFLDTLNMMEMARSLHQQGKVHRDLKYGNAFDGGTVFDNLSIADAKKVASDKFVFCTPLLIPDCYAVAWTKQITPYFRDIFAFALSMASAIYIASGQSPKMNADGVLQEFKNKDKKGIYSFFPFLFVKKVEDYFFPSVQNPKLKKAAEVVKTMISSQGAYDIAAAQRDLAAIFGSRI